MSTRGWIVAASCGVLWCVQAWTMGDPVAAQAPPSAMAPAVQGAPLPSWESGMLDIHQVATGRGNSALVVLPDGTTMLVDAGAVGDGVPQTDPHPDGSRTPGAWIARYVRRHLPADNAGLDYALITHFHPDHMGQPRADSARDARGRFQRAGITEVLDEIPTKTLIDRGAPSYDYPEVSDDPMMRNYKAFVAARATRLAGPPGHIIVRVEKGGGRYWVITTDANDERDIVTSVRGPFESGKG